MTRILIGDTETTGVKPPIKACEVAYISLEESMADIETLKRFSKLDNLSIKKALEEYLKTPGVVFEKRFHPGRPIDPKAAEITGITDEHVKDCPPISTFSFPVETEYVLFHNAIYDYPVLFEPEINKKIVDFKESKIKPICTLEISRASLGFKKNSLSSLIEQLYPEFSTELTENAHGALADCKMVLFLLVKLFRRLEYIKSWEELHLMWSHSNLDLNVKNSPFEKCPIGKYKGVRYIDIKDSNWEIWVLSQEGMNPEIKQCIRNARLERKKLIETK